MRATPDLLRVLERHVYRGPSVHGYRPLIRVVLDLGRLEHRPTSTLPGFAERLLERLPGLRDHGCSYREAGGFVRRMHEGTWLGHVIEHVALEMQGRTGAAVTFGKTRGVRGRPGVYDVVYAYEQEVVGLQAGRLAVRLVHDLLPGDLKGVEGLERLAPPGSVHAAVGADATLDLQAELDALSRLGERWALGPSTRALVDGARSRGIPVRRLDDDSLVRLGHGRRMRTIRASVTDATSAIALENASDKGLTLRLLSAAGLPVPTHRVVASAEAAVAAAEEFRGPVVVKPAAGNHGRGVSLDLEGEDPIRRAYEAAARHGERVIVERFLTGHDHRLLVVDGRFVAAARREPASVIGDGHGSIAERIEATNRDPRRGDGHDRALTRIEVDENVERTLARSGFSLRTVPAAGVRVRLRETANLSTGGTAVDVTDEVHPEVAAVAERAARAVGLDVAGIDVTAPDLRRPLSESGGAIVEVNAGPGLRMHLAPAEGRARDVAAPILDMLFPGGSDGRVPLIAITGTNGKTTTARMVARILEAQGGCVGLATSTGITIGGREVASGDTTGPWSARLVLDDGRVDAAVLETARGGILREGLGFDRCTVGAVLNVQSDHLGLGGIDTLDDMAWVKSLVAEVTAPDGFTVLNADDDLVARMRERAGGETILFSMQERGDGAERVIRHVRSGGTAVVREPLVQGDLLVILEGGRRTPVLWTREIPATLNGAAHVNVQNAAAATAIAHAVGVPPATIAQALRTFASTFEENPGRLNVFDGHPFRVVLDYGHNVDGIVAMRPLVRHLASGGRAIGVVTMCGDRRDEDLLAFGRVCAETFDHVIVREDEDRRGRDRGEIARLIRRGLSQRGLPGADQETILPEMEALEEAMRRARPGDLVVHLAENIGEAWRRIEAFRPSVVVPEEPPARDVPNPA